MPAEWSRSAEGGLHRLVVRDCPVEVVAALAAAAEVDATVENLRPVRAADAWFESVQALHPGGGVAPRRIRDAVFDVALRNPEFLDQMPFWDANGVYAVFTERSPISFRASQMAVPGRYRALARFGFVLEVALAGPASDGLSELVTPRPELIDLAVGLLGG